MSNIKRPTFTDRDVQYPNRVTLLPSEGSAVTYDVVPAPGTVTQDGTPVDSDLMNEMADYSELGYKNKLYVSADGYADDVFYETGEPSNVNIYGETKQNLWVNPSGTRRGVTVTSNEDGSMTISGTATATVVAAERIFYVLKPATKYTLSVDNTPSEGVAIAVRANNYKYQYKVDALKKTITFKTPTEFTGKCGVFISVTEGATASGTYRVMLRETTDEEIAAAQLSASTLQEGGTADIPQDHPVTLPVYPLAESEPFDWCPLGLTSVSELTLNVGEEYGTPTMSTPIDLQGSVLSSLPDGTRDVLTIDANGARSIEKNSLTITFDGSSDESWILDTSGKYFVNKALGSASYTDVMSCLCDLLPIANPYNATYPCFYVCGTTDGVQYRLKAPDVSDVSGLRSWLSSNPITVVHAIDTPQTVELGSIDPVIPPSTVTNMWASANSTLIPELDFTYDKRLSLGSNATFGFVKGDGTTIDVINGVIQLAGDVISGIWDKVKPYADATYALINHTHTASQLPKATTLGLGLVKPDGSTLSIDGNGTLSVAGGGSGYTLPPATTTTLGGIKVGDNLTVESDGTLNATGGGGSIPNPLPIAQGGTGAQTATAAEYNILGSPNASSNAIGDSDKLAVVYASPSASNGVLYTQTALKLWNYIKSKADSVYRAAAAKIPWADLEDVPASFPPSAHTHSANDITSDTLPIARGGTGGATADAALTNLGVKGSTSGDVTEHYKLGKLHFIRITGTAASLASNQTTVGPFDLGFNMPSQPSGASAMSFTQGTLLTRYTSDAKATVNTLSYVSQSSLSINLFAQQAISTPVTYDVWLAVSEA